MIVTPAGSAGGFLCVKRKTPELYGSGVLRVTQLRVLASAFSSGLL